jgi:hypothetical protein
MKLFSVHNFIHTENRMEAHVSVCERDGERQLLAAILMNKCMFWTKKDTHKKI